MSNRLSNRHMVDIADDFLAELIEDGITPGELVAIFGVALGLAMVIGCRRTAKQPTRLMNDSFDQIRELVIRHLEEPQGDGVH